MLKNYGHGYKTKVFITGISGFIGSELARHLLDGGYHVGGMLRHSPRTAANVEPLKGKADLFIGDFRDYSHLSWILRTFQPDYVLHLGAISPVSYSFDHPQEVTEVDYLGTINMVEACRREVPSLRKFIFASTMEVYGRQKEEPFDEKTIPHPNSPYAVAKYAAERYLAYLYHSYNYPVVTARGSNTFGRRNDTYFITEATITRMLKNKEAIEMGNPRPIRSYIYVKDVVNFYQSLIETDNPEILGEVFNTGPENGLSVESLVGKIAQILKWQGEIHWNTRETRAGEIYYLNPRNEKAKRMLNWQPRYSLEEGLTEVVDYWKSKLASDA